MRKVKKVGAGRKVVAKTRGKQPSQKAAGTPLGRRKSGKRAVAKKATTKPLWAKAASKPRKPAKAVTKTRKPAKAAPQGKKTVGQNVAPAITYKLRELDPQRKCGPATSVQLLYRVDETKEGVVRPHLVYYDRHGWYCEHGRNCSAVSYAQKFGDGARKHGPTHTGRMRA